MAEVNIWSAGDEITASDINNAFDKAKNDFGGDGSDGAKNVAASENLDFNSVNFFVARYSSLIVAAGQTFGATNVPATGGVMYLKVEGDCTINGTISMAGQGGAGGAGGVVSTGYDDGVTGTWGFGSESFISGAGIKGTGNAGTGGVPGTVDGRFATSFSEIRGTAIMKACGSGGGGGSTGTLTTVNGGAGGAGGGVIVLEVAGDLTFGAASTLTVEGADGSNGVNSGSGSGGGAGGAGAGGTIIVLYNGTLTNGGVTLTISGGTGGTGGTGIGGSGGDGGGGASHEGIGTIGHVNAAEAGGTGGNGGVGDSLMVQNSIM